MNSTFPVRVLSSVPVSRLGAARALLLAAAVAGCGGGGDGPSSPCTVSGVAVSPLASQVVVGQGTVMTATITPTSCSQAVQAAWESSDPSIASVNTTGVVTGVAVGGPVTITARAQGQAGTAQVTVIPVPVASVTLSTSAETIALGETVQVTATARDAAGGLLAGQSVTWESDDPARATVSAEGLVTPVAPGGPVTISATVGGRTATAAITVIAARPINRFAYVYAEDPSATSTYTPAPAVSFNATGGKIEIARTGVGTYDVVFGRLAKSTSSDREIVLVSAHGGNLGASSVGRCVTTNWANLTTSDLHVRVSCTSDSRFSVLVLGAGTLPGRSGFAWADSSGAAQYAPKAYYSYSSSGEVPSLQRVGPGDYIADLKLPHGAGDLPENYAVMAYGDVSKTCKVAAWSSTVSVKCTTLTGVAADARYDVALFEQGRPGKRFGFAVADQPATAMYTPSPSTARNSSGGAITVKRTGTGLYDVTFAGLATPTGESDHVQVIDRVTAGAYTHCTLFYRFFSAADLVARVACSNETGFAADAQFQVLVIE